MLRLPQLPYGKPIIEATTQDKYVCPPWFHPITCVTDSSVYVPESLTKDPDRIVAEVQKNISWWPFAIAGLLFAWAYKDRNDIRYPIKRNPNGKILKTCPSCKEPLDIKKVDFLKTPADTIGGDKFIYANCKKCDSTVMIKRDILKGGLADYVPDSVFDAADLKAGIEVELEHTNDRVLAKEIAKDHLLDDSDYYRKLAKIEKKKNPVDDRKIKEVEADIKKQLEELKKNNPDWSDSDSVAYLINRALRYTKEWDVLEKLKNKIKKNPAQKCYYNAHLEYKRGGKKSKHDFLLQAWDMAEAQQITRGFVNRSLKNATLESLSVQKVNC